MSTRGWYSGSAVAASSMRTFSEAPRAQRERPKLVVHAHHQRVPKRAPR
jgi:hypothetical protein